MRATGAMTAGGLSSLLIVTAILREQHEVSEHLACRLEHGAWDALAWLAKHFRIDGNPQALDVAGLSGDEAKAFEQLAPGMGTRGSATTSTASSGPW